jgi:hypothetical protein
MAEVEEGRSRIATLQNDLKNVREEKEEIEEEL